MADAFIGEIRAFGFAFAPRNWAFCQGQILPIQQNVALFSLVGVQYGGNGSTTFALPDLRGRAAVKVGQGSGLTNYPQGAAIGTESVTLLVTQLPAHNHIAGGKLATNTQAGLLGQPATNRYLSRVVTVEGPPGLSYTKGTGNRIPMAAGTLANTGGGQPHENRQPSLTMNYCICLNGVFPSRN